MSVDAPSLERLSASAVRETVAGLRDRISARFPERGLARIADELTRLAQDVADVAAEARSRLRWVRTLSRIGVALVVLATLVALVLALHDASRIDSSVAWLPLIESAINDLVFATIAVFFLHALPSRVQRGELLAQLHRLRSLAHIVDMHQLSKDPERLRDDYVPTACSPTPELDRAGMEHYLNHCSELLSLIGKVAALCAEESRDPLVLDTVGTVETLTSGMSRKIWQKISLLPD